MLYGTTAAACCCCCLKKNQNAPRPSCCFSHSAHWLPTRKKLLYTVVANPARGLLNREKKKKEKVWQRHPPYAAHSRKVKIKNHTTHPHVLCLGATQVGVTQVSARLASLQRIPTISSSSSNILDISLEDDYYSIISVIIYCSVVV